MNAAPSGSYPPVIAVYGSGRAQPEMPLYHNAVALGRALAANGFAVMTGGYAGVMEAALKGAQEAGGHTIGITTTQFDHVPSRRPNAYLAEHIHLPSAAERRAALVERAAGMVVMPGGVGTLAELVHALEMARLARIAGQAWHKPIVALGETWRSMLAPFLSTPEVAEEVDQPVVFALRVNDVIAILQKELLA
jgi:hypothetical protein